MCCGLDVMCPLQASMSEHVIPTWELMELLGGRLCGVGLEVYSPALLSVSCHFPCSSEM